MCFSNPTTKAVPAPQRRVSGSETTKAKVPGPGSLEGEERGLFLLENSSLGLN